MITIPAIGKVHSLFKENTTPGIMREEESMIEVFDEMAEGLLKTELSDYLEIYFHFDKAEPYKLTTHSYTGEFKGIFATRSPHRPSKIGSTIVKFIGRNGNLLRVRGLDALDGTPVIDIKPIHIPFTEEQLDEAAIYSRKTSPRKQVFSNIWAGKLHLLLLDVAQTHGHFCTGLALGVMMAAKAMQIMRKNSEGLCNLSAIAESVNCSLDAIQFVTGCTFGNKKLSLSDNGKLAMTLIKKEEIKVRIALRADAFGYIKEELSDFNNEALTCCGSAQDVTTIRKNIEEAFNFLKLDSDRLFEVEVHRTILQ